MIYFFILQGKILVFYLTVVMGLGVGSAENTRPGDWATDFDSGEWTTGALGSVRGVTMDILELTWSNDWRMKNSAHADLERRSCKASESFER